MIGIHTPLQGLNVYACLPAEGVKGGKDAEPGLYSEDDDAPMSEFQWEDRKVLVQSEDEQGYKEFLQSQGWKVFGPDYDGVSLALKEV